MMWELSPVLMAVAAGVAGVASWRWPRRGPPVAVATGWLGLIAGAVVLRAVSAGWLVGAVPVAAAGMASAAALAVTAPVLGSGSERDRVVSVAAGGVLALAGGVATLARARGVAETPWPDGAVLVGAFAGAVGAAMAAGLVGAVHAGRSATGRSRAETGQRAPFAWAARFAGASAAAGWLGWSVARYLTWRLRGVPSLGTPSEWVGLGVLLGVSAMVAWAFDRRTGRTGRAVASFGVAILWISALALSLASRVPLMTNLGI